MQSTRNSDHKSYITTLFRKWAPFYDYVEVFAFGLRKRVANMIGTTQVWVLDVACGTGNQTVAFAERGHIVTGIDISNDMLRYAAQKVRTGLKIEFRNGDATELPFANNTFDVSSVSFAIHDMPVEMGLRVLREMVRVTKQDGQLLIVDYNTPMSRHGKRIIHMWESRYYDSYNEKGLESYLREVDLTNITKATQWAGAIQIVVCKL